MFCRFEQTSHQNECLRWVVFCCCYFKNGFPFFRLLFSYTSVVRVARSQIHLRYSHPQSFKCDWDASSVTRLVREEIGQQQQQPVSQHRCIWWLLANEQEWITSQKYIPIPFYVICYTYFMIDHHYADVTQLLHSRVFWICSTQYPLDSVMWHKHERMWMTWDAMLRADGRTLAAHGTVQCLTSTKRQLI